MSGVVAKLSGECSASILEIAQALKNELKAEGILDSYQEINDVKIVTLVFERFYWRNGSYASLTIALREYNGHCEGELAASGGGEGIFNISWGANRNFGNEATRILMRYNLQVIEI